MVAQLTNDVCAREWLSPLPQPTDSENVIIAVRAARSLEARGELGEAARWLRRAANLVEREGDDARALALARAAADLTSMVDRESRPPASSAPPAPLAASPPTGVAAVNHSDVPVRKSIQPAKPRPPAWLSTLTLLPAAGAAAPPLTKPPPVPTKPPAPKPASSPPRPTPALSNVSSAPPRPADEVARVRKPSPASLSDRPEDDVARTGIRVAFRPSERHANIIVVRRLQAGESLPIGSREALLVLPPESSDPSQERKP